MNKDDFFAQALLHIGAALLATSKNDDQAISDTVKLAQLLTDQFEALS